MSDERLRFDEFEIDVQTLELTRSGEPVALRPQPAAVLLYLVEHAGQLVTREQLQHHLWRGDVSVDFEHSLNSAIRQVRIALGEKADAPRLLQTFPRRGYRLAAAATAVVSKAAVAKPDGMARNDAAYIDVAAGRGAGLGWLAAALATVFAVVAAVLAWVPQQQPVAGYRASTTSLAVLPFESVGAAARDHLFGEGLEQELIGDLSQLRATHLSIIAPSSTLHLDDGDDQVAAARELGAELVLLGTVRSDGDELRVTARLMEVATYRQRWAHTFEGRLADPLRLQRDISHAIVGAVMDEMLVATSSDVGKRVLDPARNAYLLGAAFFDRGAGDDLMVAVAHFRDAVALDPRMADAWAYLARSLIDAPVDQAVRLAEVPVAIDRAVALDAENANAQLALSRWRMFQDWDLAGALAAADAAALMHADAAEGKAARAAVLSALSRHEEALAEAERAVELAPLSPRFHADAAWYFYFARRWNEAVAEARLALALEEHMVRAWDVILYTSIARGDWATAREVFLHRLVDIGVTSSEVDTMASASDAELTAFFWDRYLPHLAVGATDVMPAPESLVPGLVFTGRLDEAMDALRRSVDEGEARVMPYLRVAPYLDPLRSGPDFQALQSRITWPEELLRP